MVDREEKIIAVIEVQVDDKSVKASAQKVARDTGKLLDPALLKKLQLNVIDFEDKIARVKQQLKNKDLDAATRLQLRLNLGEYKSNLTEARRRLQNFRNSGDENLSRLQKKFDQVTGEIKKSRLALLKLGEGSKNFKTIRDEINKLEKEFKDGTISVTKFQSRLRQIDKQIASSNKGFSVFRFTIKRLVATFGTLFAAGEIIQFFRSASRAAIEFESAFAGVRKTLDASEPAFRRIKRELIDLSLIVPVTFQELASIAEVGGQLGVAAEDIVKFTDVVARLGVSTNVTAEEAATAFARISNIIGEPLDNIDKLGSVVVDLGNNFATTEREILDFTTRIAATGKIVGFTAETLFGFGAAFSAAGIQAEAGGTAVQKTLLIIDEAVTTGGKKLEGFARTAGLTVDEFSKLWREDAALAFVEFIEGLGEQGPQASQTINDLIGNEARVKRSLLSVANAGDLVRRAIETNTEAYRENNALLEESEKRFNTTESQIQRQKNELEKLEAEIGTNLNPIYLDFLKTLNSVADALSTNENELISNLRANKEFLQTQIRAIETGEEYFEVYRDENRGKIDKVTDAVGDFIFGLNEVKNVTGNSERFLEMYRKNLENIDNELKELGVSIQTDIDLVVNLNEVISGLQDPLNVLTQVFTQRTPSELINPIIDGIKKINTQVKNQQLNQKLLNDLQAENPQLAQIIALENELNVVNDELREAKKNNDALGQLELRVDAERLQDELNKLNEAFRKPEKAAKDATAAQSDRVKKQVELLERIALVEAKLIQDSEDSEVKKSQKIIQINEKLNNDIKKLKGDELDIIVDTAKEAIKLAEEQAEAIQDANEDANKAVQKTFDELNDLIDDSKDNIEDYAKEIEKIGENFEKLKEKATDEIDEINQKISELEDKSDIQLAQNRVELLEEQVDLEEKLAKARGDGKISGEELEEILERQKEIADELLFIQGNTTNEAIKEAERVSKLSPSEKAKEDLEKEKNILQERIDILEQVKNDEIANIQEISNFENLKLAEDFNKKKELRDLEILQIQEKTKIEQELIDDISFKKDVFNKITEDLITNLDIEADSVTKLKDSYLELAEALSALGITPSELGSSILNNIGAVAGQPGGATTIQQGDISIVIPSITINNDQDVDELVQQIAVRVQDAKSGIK